ncbi:MAG: tetratricopeptide repeat protein, partial [Candidatus Kapaibacterium sp.]
LYNKLEMEDEYIDILVELFEKKPEQSTALQILSYYLDNKNFEKAINTLKLFETNTYGDRLAEIYEYTASYLLNDQDIIQNKTIAEYLDKIDSRFYTEWKLNFFSAMLADQINDSSKAESLYSRALKVNHDNPDIYLRYGFFYFSRENYPEADSIFTKGLDRFPEIILFPIYAASSKALSGDVETAEDWFDKAEAIDSTNVDLWIQKGIVYDNLEEYEKSDKAYSRALEIDPGNPLAANNYAYTLSLRGANLEKALRLIKAAIAVHPDNPSYLDTYAWVHYKLGNIDKAVKYIEKTVEKGGESAEVFEHMGDIYKEAGKIEKAAKAYQKALDIDPGLESVRNKLEEIR